MAKYQAYAEYKDSGIEWLGEIPGHWGVTQLKRLGKFITGMTPSTAVEAYYSDEITEYGWIRPEDILEESEKVEPTKFLTKLGWETQRTIPAQSTLICCIGTIGKLGFLGKRAVTNQQITALVPYVRSFSKYYYYLLTASRNQLEHLATGNVVKILNSERLGSLWLPLLSSQNEARQIVHFLDHETAKIDHLIEKQQQLIELLKEKRQAVISHAVTKGLDPNVLMKDSGVEWLGKVPEHWAVSKLSYVAHGFNGDRGSNYPSGQDFVDEGIPFISSSELIHSKVDPVYASKITKEKYNSLGGLKIKVGDIIYCLRGSVGKNGLCEFNEGTIASSLMGIRCFSLSPYYLLLLLNSTVEFQQRSNFTTGSVSANLSAENVMSYKFALPPIKEQIEIANNLKKVFEKYDKLILKAESAIQLMQERRTALISAAVTGKIDVRNWQAPTVTEADTELSA